MCNFLPKKTCQEASIFFRNLEDPGLDTDLLFAEDCGVFFVVKKMDFTGCSFQTAKPFSGPAW